MNIPGLREHLSRFQFQKLFIESLGWDQPKGIESGHIEIGKGSEGGASPGCQGGGGKLSYSKIAEISGVPVLKFNRQAFNQSFKVASKKFHKAIQREYHKHLLLFSDEKSFFTLSYLSKEGQVCRHDYFKGQSGDYFISKLTSVHFGIEETLKIKDIGEKLEKAFNTEKITKRFYQDFRDNQDQFQKYIEGVKTEEEKKWYASLILNRLMFIWFLQKKGFVNRDFDYLEKKLAESKQIGKDRYYSEFLTCLFFEGFAKKPIERNDKAKALLGSIKYLNGGLFIPHPIETKYEIKSSVAEYKGKIKIKDKAFEETFKIFQSYDWCLQGKEGKSDNEISPDVMGYIFEKYINQLQQKSLGAYYTRDEITQYLSRSAIQKAVLEKVNQKGYSFKSIAELLHQLDAPLCKLLLTDEGSILNQLTVLDPAVGSGAFLTAAMKELINIYSPIIGKIATLPNRELRSWLLDFKAKHKSLAFGIKKNIILKNLYGVDIMKEAVEVCKLRLFLSLVSSALEVEELEPLPNMDFNIMCGNSLIGFLREGEQEEQQQKADGHSNRGEKQKTKDRPQETQIEWAEVLGESYRQIKDKYNQWVYKYKNRPLSFAKLKELKSKTNDFLEKYSKKLSRALADKCNNAGVKYPEILDIQGKKKITQKRAVKTEDFYSQNAETNLNPFHYDFAFNEVMDRGGFDVILTNPPWDKVKIEDREFFHKYDSLIDKKKSSKSVIKNKKNELLQNPEIVEDYNKTKESYLFQREYFSKLYQYQIGVISNNDGSEKQASADMDSYRLFVERAYKLLNKNGTLGIVLPSGLCKDDGAIGLRKNLLFAKMRIDGLIDFQNQMEEKGKGRVFEGVHPQFKFLLLQVQKAQPKDEFPCLFHARDLTVLEHFPPDKTRDNSEDKTKNQIANQMRDQTGDQTGHKATEVGTKSQSLTTSTSTPKNLPMQETPQPPLSGGLPSEIIQLKKPETAYKPEISNQTSIPKNRNYNGTINKADKGEETNIKTSQVVYQSIREIKKLSPRDCAIIEFKNSMDKEILKKVNHLPPIGKVLQNLWNPVFYREFDETNDSHLFKSRKWSDNDLPLYKGSAIYQYEFNYDLSHVNRYVNVKSRKIKGTGFPFKNKCYKTHRLVIRTIARSTDERSLISAVIPKNNFISNNFIGVSISRLSKDLKYDKNLNNQKNNNLSFDLESNTNRLNNDCSKSSKKLKTFSYLDRKEQKFIENKKNIFHQSIDKSNLISSTNNHKYIFLLQAFLNSFVVDYFIRQKISSVINQKYIDSLPIPRLTEKDPYFKELVERSAKLTCIGKEFNPLADEMGIPRGGVKNQKDRWKIQGEIDAIVAYVYQLTLKEFEYILSTFTTGKNKDRLNALKNYALQAFKKNKFLGKAS